MNEPNEIVRTSRQVIEHKLLTALDDESVVACLFTKDDLETLIASLYGYSLGERKGNTLSWQKDMELRKELAESLTQLQREAFK